MEGATGIVKEDQDKMDLPPGFRFHPTDEELITHYLSKKVLDCNFSSIAIAEVDMNKVEPWELPCRAKIGETKWYFFCLRDKKYPAGQRTNRATPCGYWKATGKDKGIFRGKQLVGMKKTLVFYLGRAPKGEKSNWVSHEYRLEGNISADSHAKSVKNDWVISRVFQKVSGGERVEKPWPEEMSSEGNEMSSLGMTTMLDSSVCGGVNLEELGGGYVPFPNPTSDFPQPVLENSMGNFGNPIVPSFPAETFPMGLGPMKEDPEWAASLDPFILEMLSENYEQIQNPGLGEANGVEMVNVSQGAGTSSVTWNNDMGNKAPSIEKESEPSNSNEMEDIVHYILRTLMA